MLKGDALHTLGGGRRRRIAVHDSRRGEHNVWAWWRAARITVGVRGRGIVPCVSPGRVRIRCAWERLGRILRDHGRVGWLFGRSGGGLCLVAAHGEFVERRARKEVVRWWRAKVRISRKGAELNIMGAKHSLSRGENEEKRERKKTKSGRRREGRERGRRTSAVGRSGFQDLVAAQTQLEEEGCSASIPRELSA
jgi:hypothetical protein